MDETVIDLRHLSISEACYWLLHSLDINNFLDYVHAIPYSSYVMTWPRCVPLTAIIIGQSPYPRDIFPPIAAAMSYSTELCQQEMNMSMPPTVRILANDLYINAGMKKEDSVNIFKNGWALIDKGILLINETVFYTYDPTEAYIEAGKQCSVIIRLLQETEKYGKRTVNIYALGESGQKVASDICSWYKSSVVTLSKRAVTHPAAIARRFIDHDHPNCHMGTPSFSKSLAKCLSNHVAFMHTMSKKNEKDIKLQRLSDTLHAAADNFPELERTMAAFVTAQQELGDLPSNTDEKYKEILARVTSTADDFIVRMRICTSVINNMQSFGGSISGSVAKPAPSLRTEAPSQQSLAQHVGQDSTPAFGLANISGKTIKPMRSRISSVPTEASSFAAVSSPPSVSSIPSSSPAPQIKIKPIKRSISATPVRSIQKVMESTPTSRDDDEVSDIVSPLTQKFTKKISLSKSAPKMKLINPKMRADTPKSISESSYNPSAVALSKDHINHLSSVEAVVQMRRTDAKDDRDCQQYFADIQNDIKTKTIYNNIVRDLVDAINIDMENIPNFDFSDWCDPVDQHSETFEICKDRFELS